MRKLHWKWLAGIASIGLLGYLLWPRGNRCPVVLPPQYKLVRYEANATSSELAYQLQQSNFRSTNDIGSSEGWVFEAPGPPSSVEESLCEYLRTRKVPFRRHLRTLTVFMDIKKAPRVVLMPFRSKDGRIDPARHMVRVNGDWQKPGFYELALAKLPKSWIKKWTGY